MMLRPPALSRSIHRCHSRPTSSASSPVRGTADASIGGRSQPASGNSAWRISRGIRSPIPRACVHSTSTCWPTVPGRSRRADRNGAHRTLPRAISPDVQPVRNKYAPAPRGIPRCLSTHRSVGRGIPRPPGRTAGAPIGVRGRGTVGDQRNTTPTSASSSARDPCFAANPAWMPPTPAACDCATARVRAARGTSAPRTGQSSLTSRTTTQAPARRLSCLRCRRRTRGTVTALAPQVQGRPDPQAVVRTPTRIHLARKAQVPQSRSSFQ